MTTPPAGLHDNSGPGDTEELGNFTGGVGAGAVQLHEVLLLRRGELGLSSAELACGLGDRHTLSGAGPDEVGLELSHRAEDVEKHPPNGIGGFVDRSPEAQRDTFLCQLLCDIGRVAQ